MSSLLHASAGRTKSTTLRVQSGLKSGILAAAMMLAWLLPAAQADYQTNVISGVTNALSGDYILGFRDFLRIDSGGALFDVRGLVNGGPYGGFPPKHLISPASAIVTDPGSVWSNQMYSNVGDAYPGNSLVISNGGQVVSMFDGLVGDGGLSGVGGSNNSVVVTGTGSVWCASLEITIGQNGGASNTLVISNGGQVIDAYSRIGDLYGASNNTVTVTDPGSVWSVSGDLLLSGAYGNVLTISNSGLVAAGHVSVGGANSIVMAGGTVTATNGLVVAGTLTGWGTVNASGWDYGMSADSMQVFSGATVSASCGTLTFTTNVTNYGTLRANGSGVFDFYGAVVNYGTIDLINGSTKFHGAFINNGTVLDSNSVRVANAALADIDVIVQIGSVMGHSYQLQTTPSFSPPAWTNCYPAQAGTGGVLTFSDPGGVTNQPSRFYRIVVTAP